MQTFTMPALHEKIIYTGLVSSVRAAIGATKIYFYY